MKSINNIINENINKVLLREYYKGPLYHFTTLANFKKIVDSNCLLPSTEYNEPEKFFCFTRNKNFNIVGLFNCSTVSLRIDSDKLMTLRHAKMIPYNFNIYNLPEEPVRQRLEKPQPKNYYFEFEERLYGVDEIENISDYVDRVDIYINNYNNKYKFDFIQGTKPMEDYNDEYFNEQIALRKILSNPEWHDKIVIHDWEPD